MAATVLGVIGGSGIYGIPGLEAVRETKLDTPFGPPSDALVRGRIGETELVFLPRHGRHHTLAPDRIDYRANVCAMKLAGVTHLVSLSAVGSLREDIAPGDVVVVDQYVDWTRRRAGTFFDAGVVAHVGFADPVCPILAAAAARAAQRAGGRVHASGAYVCIEGPQFSTLAEAHVHRQLRFEIIGMTNVTEAKLAREAELCYATLAMITDYDCWHPGHSSVTVAEIIANLNQNAANAAAVLRAAIRRMPAGRECRCGQALAHAILTDPARVPPAARRRLAPLLGKYVK